MGEGKKVPRAPGKSECESMTNIGEGKFIFNLCGPRPAKAGNGLAWSSPFFILPLDCHVLGKPGSILKISNYRRTLAKMAPMIIISGGELVKAPEAREFKVTGGRIWQDLPYFVPKGVDKLGF